MKINLQDILLDKYDATSWRLRRPELVIFRIKHQCPDNHGLSSHLGRIQRFQQVHGVH